jgi:hypothetical protein
MRPIKYKGKYISSIYATAKSNAKARGVPFNLTIDEWYDWWIATGHWHERGCRKGQYVMARFSDKGPYALGNIKCILHSENASEQDFTNARIAARNPSPETRAIAAKNIGEYARNMPLEHRAKVRRNIIRMNKHHPRHTLDTNRKHKLAG